MRKFWVMILLTTAAYSLAALLSALGLTDLWVAMIVGVIWSILLKSRHFNWSNRRIVERRARVLNIERVYEVTSKGFPYGRPPGVYLRLHDEEKCDLTPPLPSQHPPPGFEVVISADKTKVFWVPSHKVSAFIKRHTQV